MFASFTFHSLYFVQLVNFFSNIIEVLLTNCKIFKLYNVMTWHTYTLWKDSPYWVTLHIHHLTYLFVFIYFFMRTVTVSLSKFQLNNTVLSAVVTMLHIRSSDLIHLVSESLFLFTNFSLFLPPSPHPPPRCSHWQRFLILLFLWVLLCWWW